MKTIQDHKTEATLKKQFRYDEGIFTRAEYMQLQKAAGATVSQSTRAQIDFSRTKYNRMDSREQEEYERKCDTRIPCFNLNFAGKSSFIEITKAEFDYFNSL